MRKYVTGIAATILLGALLGAVLGAVNPSSGWLGRMPLAAAIIAGTFLGGIGLVTGVALAVYNASFKSDGIIPLMLVGALVTFVLNLILMGNRIEDFGTAFLLIGLGCAYAAAYKGAAVLSARLTASN